MGKVNFPARFPFNYYESPVKMTMTKTVQCLCKQQIFSISVLQPIQQMYYSLWYLFPVLNLKRSFNIRLDFYIHQFWEKSLYRCILLSATKQLKWDA